MRIAAFVSHPIQHLTPLWKELSRQSGVELKVFYFSDQGVKPSYDPGFGVVMAWDVNLLEGHDHQFLPRQWPTRSSLDYSPKGLNKDLKSTLQQGWDAVYVAGYHHANNWAIIWHCRRMGIPALCQIDSNFLAESRKPAYRLWAKAPFIRIFFKLIAGGLAIGDHCRDYFIHYGLPAERVYFCPLPVDIGRFRNAVASATSEQIQEMRDRYHLPADKKLIMFAGKLTEGKRPLDLIHAMHILNDPSAMAVFVGDGVMRPAMEREGGDKIIITGFVNQKEIPLLLSMAKVSVLTSEFDAHPLAVTEASCLGIPVVLSDACGCWGPHDILRDGENGLLYPCGNAAALAEKVRYLLDHEDVWARMSQCAKELAETQSPAQAAQSFLAAARAAIGGGS